MLFLRLTGNLLDYVFRMPCQERLEMLCAEAHFEESSWDTVPNFVSANGLRHNGIGPNDCFFANNHAPSDGDFSTDPDILTNHERCRGHVSPEGALGFPSHPRSDRCR